MYTGSAEPDLDLAAGALAPPQAGSESVGRGGAAAPIYARTQHWRRRFAWSAACAARGWEVLRTAYIHSCACAARCDGRCGDTARAGRQPSRILANATACTSEPFPHLQLYRRCSCARGHTFISRHQSTELQGGGRMLSAAGMRATHCGAAESLRGAKAVCSDRRTVLTAHRHRRGARFL